jgi:hypothetical protein
MIKKYFFLVFWAYSLSFLRDTINAIDLDLFNINWIMLPNLPLSRENQQAALV